jgi:hypothetical protein
MQKRRNPDLSLTTPAARVTSISAHHYGPPREAPGA